MQISLPIRWVPALLSACQFNLPGQDDEVDQIPNEINDIILHASCVTSKDGAVLILGQSGSGKSGLALELMALGAVLVADDRVKLYRENGGIVAVAPETIAGRIEARYVGILKAEVVARASLKLIVDLDRIEAERLPPQRSKDVLGISFPLLHNVETRYFSAAILQYLKAGRDG